MRKSRRPLRIAYGRVAQETHAFSPVTTTLDDFKRNHWLEGDALQRACGLLGNELPGWTPFAECSGLRLAARLAPGRVDTVPTISTLALPSGPIDETTVTSLRDALVGRLRRSPAPIDGVFLALHGAMRSRGALAEPEEAIVAAVREVVGPFAPIAISLDLHGQLTPALVERADILVGYRTNPHRDLFQAGLRAGGLLIRAARGEVQPTVAWRTLPMVLGGGVTIDLLPPMRPIFRRMKAMQRGTGVLSVSLFMCHPYNDSPELGWSVYVLTDGDQQLAERLADELAELAWSVRNEQPPRFQSTAEALGEVRRGRWARRLGTFCLTDCSDVVGAGATGENTNIVAELIEHSHGLRCYAALRDEVAVAELADSPVGSSAHITVGGRLDPAMNPPLALTGRIRGRATHPNAGQMVSLDLGDVAVVLTERSPFNIKPSFFSGVGLDPWRSDCVVIKSFFHFRIFYLPLMRGSIPVQTRGLTDLSMVQQVPFRDPVHPLHDVDDWRATDRRRRGR